MTSGADRLSQLGDTLTSSGRAFNARYSSWVRLLRLALPIIALALVAAIFWLGKSRDFSPVPREQVLDDPQGRTSLLNPRFESSDGDKQPYTITAKAATQDQAQPDLVHLDQPVADLTLSDGSWIAIKARTGTLQQEKQILSLLGDMRLYHDSGYELLSDAADIDIRAQKAVTRGPVRGHGPMGTIEGARLRTDGITGILTFDGPARLVLTKGLK